MKKNKETYEYEAEGKPKKKKKPIRWLIAGVALLVLSGIVTAICVPLGLTDAEGWEKIVGNMREKQGLYRMPLAQSYTVETEISDLDFSAAYSSVIFRSGTVEKVTVSYYEDFEGQFEVSETAGTLSFKQNTSKAVWFDMTWVLSILNNKFDYYKIYVTLPADFVPESVNVKVSSGSAVFSGIACGDVTAETSSGAIDVENCRFGGSVSLKVSSGKIELENVTATAGIDLLSTKSGGIELENLTVAGGITEIHSGSGNITLEKVEAARIEKIRADSGRITLENVTADYVNADSGSGRIELSASRVKEAYCKSSSGNVIFEDMRESNTANTAFDVRTSSGSIRINGERIKGGEYKNAPDGAEYKITVNISSGSFRFE